MELPLTKMEETWIGVRLRGGSQLSLILLSLRYLIGIQGESGVGVKDVDGRHTADSHHKQQYYTHR